YLGAEIGMQPQLITDSRTEHVAGGFFIFLARLCPHTCITRHFDYIDTVACFPNVPAVAHHPMNCWRGAGIDTGVAWPSGGRHIVEMIIGKGESLVDQSFESIFPKLIPIFVDIVGAHLIHHNPYNEFGCFMCRLLRLRVRINWE